MLVLTIQWKGIKQAELLVLHIHTLAEAYGATVILHTDHCAKKYCLGLMDY
jgi:fructose/tagatose bisphosphate aldolase